ncbi:MAG: NADPH-dependent glutamate synthase [Oscillospiraceae bacterium]|nr:NADPH-dependent glutamate synthase [Oscillospiraceae bacterium]
MADNISVKVPMPEQPPQVRNKNFEEVALGYDKTSAGAEAKRCLQCKDPLCVNGCPVKVKIPEFIKLTAEEKFEEAYLAVTADNSLPAVCGRVCPQESQCEKFCIRGRRGDPVAIGRLERFVADHHMANEKAEDDKVLLPLQNGQKVAVIGSGPTGLTCAGDLNRMGFDVTIFESLHKPGGVLVYGIPEFRLPKEIVSKEIKKLEQRGVKIVLNAAVGRAVSVDELFEEGFKAVYVGTGAGTPLFMKIPGESLLGVYSANEYLTRVNLMKAYLPEYDTPIKAAKRVAVVGGGNVAMDAARCALRLGAEEVHVIYRRGPEEMPARAEEVHHAREEGIIFKFLCNPVALYGDEKDHVQSIECVEMELKEPDSSGRRRPAVKEGSNFNIEADAVIMALGTSPNPIIENTTKGLTANDKGCICVDEKMCTARPGVYAGGDTVTGAATVILAMGAGKTAAESIAEYLNSI